MTKKTKTKVKDGCKRLTPEQVQLEAFEREYHSGLLSAFAKNDKQGYTNFVTAAFNISKKFPLNQLTN